MQAFFFKKTNRASAVGTASAKYNLRIGPTQWMVALRSCRGAPSNRTLDHDAPWILAASRPCMATTNAHYGPEPFFHGQRTRPAHRTPPGSFFLELASSATRDGIPNEQVGESTHCHAARLAVYRMPPVQKGTTTFASPLLGKYSEDLAFCAMRSSWEATIAKVVAVGV